MVPVNNSYEYTEKQIASLIFEGNFLKKVERRKIGRYEVNVDEKNVSPSQGTGIFNPNDLKSDDVANSTLLSSVQELVLFQDIGIRTLLIRDTLNATDGIREVSYSVELNVENSFREYILFLSKRLDESINFLNL